VPSPPSLHDHPPFYRRRPFCVRVTAGCVVPTDSAVEIKAPPQAPTCGAALLMSASAPPLAIQTLR
jgi:hypothetical protein